MTYLHVVCILYTCSMFHEEQILVAGNQEDKHIRYKDTVSVKTKTNIRYLCLFAYNGVQHIMCCGFFLSSPCAWWCQTHIVVVLIVFILCMMVFYLSWSCVSNFASFSGVSILNCSFGFSIVYIHYIWKTIRNLG